MVDSSRRNVLRTLAAARRGGSQFDSRIRPVRRRRNFHSSSVTTSRFTIRCTYWRRKPRIAFCRVQGASGNQNFPEWSDGW